jgi:hypothetical protein
MRIRTLQLPSRHTEVHVQPVVNISPSKKRILARRRLQLDAVAGQVAFSGGDIPSSYDV